VAQVTHGDTESTTATCLHVHSSPGDTLPAANLDESNMDADMHLEGKGTPIKEEPWDMAYQAML
jgi:hypothetical protein